MLVTDLQYVAPDVVSEGPAQAVQDVQHLFLLQHGEEAVEKDLEPDGYGLGAVQHQAADVEHHVRLNDLHLGRVVQVLGAELVQSCVTRGDRKRKCRDAHTKARGLMTESSFPLISNLPSGAFARSALADNSISIR